MTAPRLVLASVRRDSGAACDSAPYSWALEAQLIRTSAGVVLYGVAVAETATVRAGTRRSAVARVAPGPVQRRFGVRYFAARVPGSAFRVQANDIVAFIRTAFRKRGISRALARSDAARQAALY